MSSETILCSDSLLEALEAQGGFQPLETRTRLEPGEGLTKIWMCPSSEMRNALFSIKPENLLLTTNLGRDSLNIIEKVTNAKDKVSDVESGSSSSGSVWKYDESDLDQSDRSSIKVGGSAQGLSSSSDISLKDERIDHLKKSLKQIYSNKLAAGANMLVNYSLEILDNQIYNLVNEIRLNEVNRINSELKPVVDFIEKYKSEVNRENGHKLKRKYLMERRAGISRLVDATEESFTQKCLQIEKKLVETFNFRVLKMRNNYYMDYRKRLRSDLNKLIGKFKEERDKIMNEYVIDSNLIEEEYNTFYKELKASEESKVQEEVQKITEYMDELDSTEEKKKKKTITKCSEESGWLCVLLQLLNDMQLFLKTYISSEVDIRVILSKIKEFEALKQRKKSKIKSLLYSPTDVEATSVKEPSILTIPCIRDRNEELHQALVQEAKIILEKILSDVIQIITQDDYNLMWGRIYRSSSADFQNARLLKYFQSDENFSRFNFSEFSISDDSTLSIDTPY